MHPEPPAIYLITGPMGAGKTTVADLLARRFRRGVHLEGDVFFRAVKAGRVEMTPDASAEALSQLRLRYRLSAACADAFVDEGFTVALEDVVAGSMLDEYRAMITRRPCHVVVLLPSLEEVTRRAERREQTGYGHFTPEGLYRVFAEETPRVGVWLDTSSLSAEGTVDAILRATAPGGRMARNPRMDPDEP